MAEQVVKLRLDTSGFDRALRGATAALAGLVSVNTLRSITQITANFEDLQDTLTSVTGSAARGRAAFKGIQDFATRTQFSVEDLTQVFIKLQGAGITPTEELLTTFTDTAAVTTDQIGTLTAISDLFSRTVSGGLGLEELNRLADRGVPVFKILEEQLGLTRLEVSEFGKTAEGAAKITQALTVGLDDAFGGATAQKLDNLSTLQSNFGIQLRNTANIFGTELSPALKEAIADLTEFLNQNDRLAATLGAGLGDAIRVASESVKFLAENFDLLRNAVLSLVGVQLFRNLQSIFARTSSDVSNLKNKTGSLSTVFRRFGENLKKSVIGPIRTLFPILARFLNPYTLLATVTLTLVDRFFGLGKVIFIVRGLFGDFLGFLNRVYQGIRQFIADALNPLIEGWNFLAGAVSDATVSLLEGAKSLGVDPGELPLVGRIAELAAEYDALQLAQQKATEDALKVPDVPGLPTASNDNGTPTTGVAGPTQAELDKQKEALDNQFLQLTQALYTQEEAESIAYQNRLQILEDYYLQSNMTQARYNEIKERIETAHSKKMADIAKANYDKQLNLFKSGKFAEIDFSKFSEKEKTKFIVEGGREALDALGQHSKEAFQLAKAAALAEAVINTAQGVTKALAQGGVFGPLLAGVIVAAGAAQIATIASQQYQGRQFGGPVSKGRQYLVGENGPEMFVPAGSGQIVPNRGLDDNNVVNINFNIQAVDAQGLDQVILQRKGLITNIVREGMENQGRRSVV